MIDPNIIYQGVKDDASTDENGDLKFSTFQRNLERAELFLLKYLTGDVVVDAKDFPQPFETQKLKDYLAPFITTEKFAGDFKFPANYYQWQHLYKLGKRKSCDENESFLPQCDKPIPVMDKDVIDGRCNSHIKSLRPSGKAPVARIVNNGVQVYPENAGGVGFDYIRYPLFGKFKWKHDPVRNEDVYDPIASTSLEWGDWAREPLIWFIVNRYSTGIRETALKQFTLSEKPRG